MIQALRDGQQYASDMQSITTVKTMVDGVPEGKTAYLLKPYAKEAGMPADYKGNSMWNDDHLRKFVAAIDKAGFRVHIHAMGDGGVHQVLDAIENAYNQNGKRDGRHIIAHATLVDKPDVARMAKLGVYGAMQPIWFYKDPMFSTLEKQMFGEERFKNEYAIKDMLDAGIIMTGSADAPVTPDDRPLVGIEVGVTQSSPYPDHQNDPEYVRDANQRVSVLDMLRMYTINGAKEMSMEKIIGSIEVGKKADMVVLGQDITKIKPQDIAETEIINTIFSGKIIYAK